MFSCVPNALYIISFQSKLLIGLSKEMNMAANKLFVGSLGYNVTDEELSQFFVVAGSVVSAKVIIDRDTNRSKGFGFVEMSSDQEAQAAIQQLNGKELDGRQVAISVAKPMGERPARPSFNNNRRPRY